MAEVVACSYQQHAVDLVVGVIGGLTAIQDIKQLCLVHFQFPGDVARVGFGENLGTYMIGGGRRDDRHTDGLVTVDIHETKGDEAVEPGVGDLVDHSLLAVTVDLFVQLLQRISFSP